MDMSTIVPNAKAKDPCRPNPMIGSTPSYGHNTPSNYRYPEEKIAIDSYVNQGMGAKMLRSSSSLPNEARTSISALLSHESGTPVSLFRTTVQPRVSSAGNNSISSFPSTIPQQFSLSDNPPIQKPAANTTISAQSSDTPAATLTRSFIAPDDKNATGSATSTNILDLQALYPLQAEISIHVQDDEDPPARRIPGNHERSIQNLNLQYLPLSIMHFDTINKIESNRAVKRGNLTFQWRRTYVPITPSNNQSETNPGRR